jgi:WD40 repeat protein
LAFSPDGKTVAGGLGGSYFRSFQNGGVLRWDVATGKSKDVQWYHWVDVSSIAFSPDGKTLAWTVDKNIDSIEDGVHLWEETAQKDTTILKEGGCPTFSPDRKTLAMSLGNTIKLWDLTGRKEIATLRGHGGPVKGVAFSPSGKTLASGSADKSVKLWAVQGGKDSCTLRGHNDEVLAVAFSPDGATLASASRDKTIKLWKFQTRAD